MSRVIIAFDNEDVRMGDFFLACGEDLIAFLQGSNIQPILLRSNNLSEASVQIMTEPHPVFLFGAYSHGGADRLVVNNLPYISTTVNITTFNNSFFYTCSCHTGRILGQQLVNNGCRSYRGYNNTFTIWSFNIGPFVECANHGFKEFIQGKTVSQVVESMKMKYTEHIDNYINDIFGAAFLVDNRNALVWHGEDIDIGAR